MLLLLLLEEEPLLRPELDRAPRRRRRPRPTPSPLAPSSRHPSPTVPPNLLVYLRADLSELPAWALTEAEALPRGVGEGAPGQFVGHSVPAVGARAPACRSSG